MTFIREDDQARIRERLAAMEHPVRIVHFTQELECPSCRETRQLLEEVANLSDKLCLDTYSFLADREKAQAYGVDKVPATILVGAEDYGIRFYGIPAGYEFGAFLDDLVMVSSGDSGLAPETRETLRGLRNPVHIQVFVTPTCPYCPGAVRLAHQFALESRAVTADMVEATEFPHLVQRYGVMGVPKIVVNGVGAAEGLLPESAMADAVLRVLEPTGATNAAREKPLSR